MRRALPALLLLALAAGAHQARVRLIRAWLRPGPLVASLQQREPQHRALPTGPLRPVRVLLVDGLSAAVAAQLPAHRQLCVEGLRLTVDVGFPTVSLPVQHVLWTGAWQLDSGVTFAIARLTRRLLPSLPELVARRSGQAVAIAESHRQVVASFPFTRVVAPPEGGAPMSPPALERAAIDEARSGAALVLVHTLAVDEAGHYHGSLSSRYLEAARRSDELLARLMAARRPDWTLLVLADHGHLGRGGHGDVEAEVRFPMACLAGPGIPAGRSLSLGLPDLTAVLAERLGVAAPGACAGHGLEALLEGAEPARPPGPRRGSQRLLLGLLPLAVLAAVLLSFRRRLTRRGLVLLLPWGPAIAALLLLSLGPPSLSRAFVYPAVSPWLLWVGAAGGLLLALQLATARRLGVAPSAALGALAAGLLAPTLAAVSLGGWPLLHPPLVPFWSAWAACLLEVSAVGLAVLAVAVSASASAGRR